MENNSVIKWLLEENNPAVRYRTLTEILNQSDDSAKSAAIEWINGKLPENWYDTKGLWYVYYVTALAECGLTREDIDCSRLQRAFEAPDSFNCGCADFMLLRALIKLGFSDEPAVCREIKTLNEHALPDGGFLCLNRLKKFKYIPKSCYKANLHALMFLAECRKKGIEIDLSNGLTEYFMNRNIFYKSTDKSTVILDCAMETFSPFEPMRVGIHNIVEAFYALGYGNDERLNEAWTALNKFRDDSGRVLLNQTLTKSYLPKEKIGQPSKWVTFYTMLAEKEK